MLFVGEGGPPQINGFGGRGTLRSWVRSIGVRTGRRLLGVESAQAPGDGELDALPAAVRDPELELLQTRYRDQVREAFAAAFMKLSERQRNVLRQYYIDGLTIDQLGALYQINRATAARWVGAARMAVVAATSAELVDRFHVPSGEVSSIIRLVRSQLDVSVRELVI
jgi:RNA polymerase sigma-70 factor (ECF subfamily)